MTIQEIFERYEIPDTTRQNILFQAGFIKMLHANWLGPDIDWRALTRGALFYDFGNEEITAVVRKKIGVDKFIVNIISRSVEKRLQEIVTEYDLYHKILLLSALFRYSKTKTLSSPLELELVKQIEEYLLHPMESITSEPSEKVLHALLAIDVKHYKNPSV